MARMAVPARINLVTLGVSDVARSTAFYEALGWRRSSVSQDAVSFLQLGAVVLSLFGHDDLAADAGVAAGAPPPFRGVTLAINVEADGDVGAVLAEAERAGATVVKPSSRADWGGTTGYFADPDGHLWEVAHNPGFPFAPDGSLLLPE